eukprot:2805787-Lingulodinium_polyedra.AAC.1
MVMELIQMNVLLPKESEFGDMNLAVNPKAVMLTGQAVLDEGTRYPLSHVATVGLQSCCKFTLMMHLYAAGWRHGMD